MNPDRVLVCVPVVLPPERAYEAFAHYDRPVLLIDNSPDSAYVRLRTDARFTVEAWPQNLGVARSWNRGLARRAELTILLSSSVVFDNGLAAAVALIADNADEYGCLSMLGLHCHAWTPRAIDTVGTWDENFWPGYYEDNDYLRRADFAGVHNGDRPMPKVAIEGTRTEYSRTKLAFDAEGGYDHAIQARYYSAKWGDVPGGEWFTTPFNSGRPLTWWPPAPPPEEQRRMHERGSSQYIVPRVMEQTQGT